MFISIEHYHKLNIGQSVVSLDVLVARRFQKNKRAVLKMALQLQCNAQKPVPKSAQKPVSKRILN